MSFVNYIFRRKSVGVTSKILISIYIDFKYCGYIQRGKKITKKILITNLNKVNKIRGPILYHSLVLRSSFKPS